MNHVTCRNQRIARRSRRLFVVLSLLVTCTRVSHANPALQGYADDATFQKQIEELDRSDIVTASSLGKTLGGREVVLLTIGTGDPHSKPALLILGGVHEPHLLGAELAVRIARQLVRRYPEDKNVSDLLQKRTIYVIPRPNPDGLARLWSRPWRERTGNDRRTDEDRDFRVGEDPPEDLNNDGWITLMRVRDPSGSYMPHSGDARVMIQAESAKNEKGLYRIHSEGIDNDKDEQWNEDAADGVSFNRNFTFRYPQFETGAGPHAVSEVETRAVADFAFDHPNIAAVFSFGPQDNLMHTWKPDAAAERNPIKTNVLAADAPYFEFLAERYRGIQASEGAPASLSGAGSFAEWAYFHWGRWSFCARGWWPPKTGPASSEKAEKPQGTAAGDSANQGTAPKEPPKDASKEEKEKPKRDDRGADELNALRWMDKVGVNGFVPWTRINHPDFPGREVEVGGWKPFYRLNPPAAELEQLGEKHYRFVAELMSLLPNVKVETTKVEALGQGVYRVVVRAVNLGFLPTASEMGRGSQHVPPLQVELKATANLQFLQGHGRATLPRLTGNGGIASQTWVVRLPNESPAKVKVRVWAPSVGADEIEIELKDRVR